MNSTDWIPRFGESRLRELMTYFPAVLVTGSRQVGKSSLFQQSYTGVTRYVLDRPRDLAAIQSDPEGTLFAQGKNPLLLDEVQNWPEIFSWLKHYIDDHRSEKGRYGMTGSEQFGLMKGVSESLAGRIGILRLFPLMWAELEACNRLPAAGEERLSLVIHRGLYPELWSDPAIPAHAWWEGYLDTYLDRDVRMLHGVSSLGAFRKLMGLLAVRCGQLLNVSELARDAGVPVSTTREWLQLLEASFLIKLVHPWHANFGKRLIKSPKVFFVDTGLVCYLLGISTPAAALQSGFWGYLFENLVIMEAHKRLQTAGRAASIYFLRSADGFEIDLVIEEGGALDLFEVKSSRTVTIADAPALRYAIERLPVRRAAILTPQEREADRRSRIAIEPWTEAVPLCDIGVSDRD